MMSSRKLRVLILESGNRKNGDTFPSKCRKTQFSPSRSYSRILEHSSHWDIRDRSPPSAGRLHLHLHKENASLPPCLPPGNWAFIFIMNNIWIPSSSEFDSRLSLFNFCNDSSSECNYVSGNPQLLPCIHHKEKSKRLPCPAQTLL